MIVVDIETTGSDPFRHAIISVGAIDFLAPTERFYEECRVSDDAVIDDGALAVNGFDARTIRASSRQSVDDLLRHFVVWLNRASTVTLAGHNPTFDRDFLLVAAHRAHIATGLGQRTVDLHALCYAHHLTHALPIPLSNRRSAFGSNEILTFVGLPSEPDPHHALTGALMEAEAFSRLIHKRNLLPEFATHPIPDHLTTAHTAQLALL